MLDKSLENKYRDSTAEKNPAEISLIAQCPTKHGIFEQADPGLWVTCY